MSVMYLCDRCNKEVGRQRGCLPWGAEQIPDHSLEENINVLEGRLPQGLWVDEETGEIITVSMALESAETRRKALGLLHMRVAENKRTYENSLWDFAVFTNAVAGVENLPPPTEDDIRDYYASREWAGDRAVAFDRAGYRCQGCGDHKADLEVHHKRKVREYWYMRGVKSNHEVLCISCHHQRHQREKFEAAADDETLPPIADPHPEPFELK